MPLDSEKCQDYKIRLLVAEILHIVWWGYFIWATLYISDADYLRA